MNLKSIFSTKEEPKERRIEKEEVILAAEVLRDYKKSKSSLEERITEDEQW